MTNWQPNVSQEVLQKRADFFSQIRQFFSKRKILEVHPPVLGIGAGTDIYLDPIAVPDYGYLQTSPEFYLKRLLAAGVGDLYSLGPAFRGKESGRWHATEFMMLEWYRVGYTHIDLMREMSEFLQAVLGVKPAELITYQALFEKYCNLNPHTAQLNDLIKLLKTKQIYNKADLDKDTALNFLFNHLIEPNLGVDAPAIVYDYPASQAALARIRTVEEGGLPGEFQVAERFEVYIQGVELANGYHELNNYAEQKARLESENKQRAVAGRPIIPVDPAFIEAIRHLPDCAGVALGVDRLLALKLNKNRLSDVTLLS